MSAGSLLSQAGEILSCTGSDPTLERPGRVVPLEAFTSQSAIYPVGYELRIPVRIQFAAGAGEGRVVFSIAAQRFGFGPAGSAAGHTTAELRPAFLASFQIRSPPSSAAGSPFEEQRALQGATPDEALQLLLAAFPFLSSVFTSMDGHVAFGLRDPSTIAIIEGVADPAVQALCGHYIPTANRFTVPAGMPLTSLTVEILQVGVEGAGIGARSAVGAASAVGSGFLVGLFSERGECLVAAAAVDPSVSTEAALSTPKGVSEQAVALLIQELQQLAASDVLIADLFARKGAERLRQAAGRLVLACRSDSLVPRLAGGQLRAGVLLLHAVDAARGFAGPRDPLALGAALLAAERQRSAIIASHKAPQQQQQQQQQQQGGASQGIPEPLGGGKAGTGGVSSGTAGAGSDGDGPRGAGGAPASGAAGSLQGAMIAEEDGQGEVDEGHGYGTGNGNGFDHQDDGDDGISNLIDAQRSEVNEKQMEEEEKPGQGAVAEEEKEMQKAETAVAAQPLVASTGSGGQGNQGAADADNQDVPLSDGYNINQPPWTLDGALPSFAAAPTAAPAALGVSSPSAVAAAVAAGGGEGGGEGGAGDDADARAALEAALAAAYAQRVYQRARQYLQLPEGAALPHLPMVDFAISVVRRRPFMALQQLTLEVRRWFERDNAAHIAMAALITPELRAQLQARCPAGCQRFDELCSLSALLALEENSSDFDATRTRLLGKYRENLDNDVSHRLLEIMSHKCKPRSSAGAGGAAAGGGGGRRRSGSGTEFH